jgi:hypothetical protein
MISKYPIEIGDTEGIADAVNYLLSGPAGLGQNFDGFSDFSPLVIRPTFARPFTLPTDTTLDASWYLRLAATSAGPTPSNPTQFITIGFAGYTDAPFQFGDTLRLSDFADSGLPYGEDAALDTPTGTKATLATTTKFGPLTTTTVTGTGSGAKVSVTLTSGAATPYTSGNTVTQVDIFNVGTGYTVGDTILILGSALGGTSPANDLTLTVNAVDSEFYNDSYFVYSSTASTVTLYTTPVYNWPTVTTLGEINRAFINTGISTDCIGQVVVNSTTQRNFITAQVDFTYTVETETAPPLPAWYTETDFDIVIQVNRYTVGRNKNGNQVFSYQTTLSQKILSETPTSPTFGEASAVFTTVIDQELNYGSYAYLLEISFVTAPRISNGSSAGISGFGTTPGWLYDMGFQTAPLPAGVANGNIQNQSTPGGTAYAAVVPTVLTGSGTNPILNITVWPNALLPNYTVGDPDAGGTIEIELNNTTSTNNTGFVPGDVLKILGTDIGGASPLNDFYFTVTETDLRSTTVPGKFTMGLRNLTTQVIKE